MSQSVVNLKLAMDHLKEARIARKLDSDDYGKRKKDMEKVKFLFVLIMDLCSLAAEGLEEASDATKLAHRARNESDPKRTRGFWKFHQSDTNDDNDDLFDNGDDNNGDMDLKINPKKQLSKPTAFSGLLILSRSANKLQWSVDEYYRLVYMKQISGGNENDIDTKFIMSIQNVVETVIQLTQNLNQLGRCLFVLCSADM